MISPVEDPDISTDRSLGLLRISGAERIQFLQGQLTQDMENLTDGRALLAGWANAKGRLRCLGWLLEWQDAVWFVLPVELLASVEQQLSMYMLRAEVRIEAPDLQLTVVSREAARQLAEFTNLPDNSSVNTCIYSANFAFISLAHQPDLGLLIGPPDAAGDSSATWADWHRAELLAGMPSVWAATSERFVPQMLNLDLLDAISFTKGCYVGQEIVARTQNLGRIKRRMHAFSTAGRQPMTPGQPIYANGEKAGELVDGIEIGDATHGLAVIPIDKRQESFSLGESGSGPLQPRDLPYPAAEN